jgi:membrane-bound metal-dependent hydrolase YbcI (DUF457 family)
LFAVGHMSLAYLLGKGSGKALHIKPNIPLLMVLSILPDIDILFDFLSGAEIHRGPTHSILVAALAFIPIFIYYRKKAIPYFLALISHPLLADFIIGGHLQLFWPISSQEFGLHELGGPYINIFSSINIALEMGLFVIAMIALYKSGDWRVFISSNKTNLILIIPIATVLLPSTVGYPFSSSLIFSAPLLALAHVVYLVLFLFAVITTTLALYRKLIQRSHDSNRPLATSNTS